MSAASDVLGLVGTTVDQVRFDAYVEAGGFGVVYRGRHLGMDEDVAIKCLRMATMGRIDEKIREQLNLRFRDETRILYRLSQGNLDIVRALGSGTVVSPATNEVTPYMVLEWLDGMTLSADLRRRKTQGIGRRSLREAFDLLDSAAGALSYAHTHDVVHRDIKPGNLFLTNTREGVRVKVLDFGLAKILSNDAIGLRPSVETGAGVYFCSPSYGAPEQFMPKIGPVGPWTDVYSFTLVLLEVLTGEKVRPASNLADGLVKALDPKAGSPRASALGLRLPPPVEDLLARAVAKEPLERPHDVGVFWSALREVMTSTKPVDLQATVADGDVDAAMAKVREVQEAKRRAAAEAAALAPTPLVPEVSSPDPAFPRGAAPDPAFPRGSAPDPAHARSPFAGTMLMETAPPGAPHLVSGPGPGPGGVPTATSPLAGTIVPTTQRQPNTGVRPAAGAPPPAQPLPQQPLHGQPLPTQPPGMMQRPMSMPSQPPYGAPGLPSRPPPAHPIAVPTIPPPGGTGGHARRTAPPPPEPMPVEVPKSSGGLVFGVVVLLLLVVGGGVYAYLHMRH